MTIHLSSPTVIRPPQIDWRPAPLVIAACAAIAILAAVGLAWHAIGYGASRGESAVPGAVEDVSAPAEPPVTIYLTASRAEAVALERELRWFVAKHEGGATSANDWVIAAGTPADVARARQVITTLSFELGAERVQVIDLRQPVPDALPAAPAATTSGCGVDEAARAC